MLLSLEMDLLLLGFVKTRDDDDDDEWHMSSLVLGKWSIDGVCKDDLIMDDGLLGHILLLLVVMEVEVEAAAMLIEYEKL
ncbi:hypothetical protein Sjap_026422 [Stephania japonica]|uniref:Uncharacterized protein n=1 Tax=Stephania japonica TaxID=461633 RepID=A0AAP0HIV8_9MAGN